MLRYAKSATWRRRDHPAIRALKQDIRNAGGQAHFLVHPFFPMPEDPQGQNELDAQTRKWIAGKAKGSQVPLIVLEESGQMTRTIRRMQGLAQNRNIYVIPTQGNSPTPTPRMGETRFLGSLGIRRAHVAGRMLDYTSREALVTGFLNGEKKGDFSKMALFSNVIQLNIQDYGRRASQARKRREKPELSETQIMRWLERAGTPKLGCVGGLYLLLRHMGIEANLMPGFSHHGPITNAFIEKKREEKTNG